MITKTGTVGIKARDAALKGANYVADAVKSTLGPFGQNALMEKGGKSTNDGFLISQELCGAIENEFERRGALVGHEASSKTNDMVGDATSTAWALEQAIANEAVRYLPKEGTLASKKTPSEVRMMIEESRKNVIDSLRAMATPVETVEGLIDSAMVSVEDRSLAEMLGRTQWDLGPEGIIMAEEVNDAECSIEKVRGIRIDNGFGTSIVVTNPEKGSLEIADCATFLTNFTMQKEDILKLKDTVFSPMLAKGQRSIAIIARAFSSEAIQLCVDTSKAGLNVYPINAPYTNQGEIMRDLQTVLGGRYIDQEESFLEDVTLEDVGHCERLVARQFDAIIAGKDDGASQARVKERTDLLKARLKGEASDFEKKNLQTRISQLSNGFAIMKVGAPSVVERKRRKDKVDDAVNAVRLALKGGTVKGAGLAFKEVSESLQEGDILKRPLLCINDQIMSSAPEGFQVEPWVRDPLLVMECALTNACDVASTLVTTNIVIATKNPDKCNCVNNQSHHNENQD